MMNKIPKGWEVKKLGEIFNIVRGGSPRPIKSYLTDDKNGINWIKIGDIETGSKYITHTKQKILASGLKKSRAVKAGDLLLTNSMSFGRPYISKINGAVHDGWLIFEPKIQISKDYVFYFFSSSDTYSKLSNLAVGSTVKNLQISLAFSKNAVIIWFVNNLQKMVNLGERQRRKEDGKDSCSYGR